MNETRQDKKDSFKEDFFGLFFGMGHFCSSVAVFNSTLGLQSINFRIIVGRGLFFDKSTVSSQRFCMYEQQ